MSRKSPCAYAPGQKILGRLRVLLLATNVSVDRVFAERRKIAAIAYELRDFFHTELALVSFAYRLTNRL